MEREVGQAQGMDWAGIRNQRQNGGSDRPAPRRSTWGKSGLAQTGLLLWPGFASTGRSSVNSETNYENLRYEGFGPDKIAVIVEALTDNKNRTASNVRSIFVKSGGNLGTQGSASHNFNQLGIIKIDKKEISDEQIFELAIESGADECISSDQFHEIQCPMSEIYNVKKNLEKTIANFISTEIEWVPLNSVDVEKDKVEAAIEFLETLEDDDDVQSVYSNINFKNS